MQKKETLHLHASFEGSGWLERAPLSKEEASRAYGEAIPAQVWNMINQAFAQFGRDKDERKSLKNSKKKDYGSWDHQKFLAVKNLEKAESALRKCLGNNQRLLLAVERNLEPNSGIVLDNLTQRLGAAYEEVLSVLTIVERAEPAVYQVPSDSESRRALTRNIKDIFDAEGLDTSLSNGRTLPDDASEADLTPFEQVLSELGVHLGDRPSATAKWIRDALAGTK